jgi:hypothetical protein
VDIETLKIEMPFTVNVYLPEDREKLANLGNEIAKERGLKFEGYQLFTQEPYSLESSKPTLFFS